MDQITAFAKNTRTGITSEMKTTKREREQEWVSERRHESQPTARRHSETFTFKAKHNDGASIFSKRNYLKLSMHGVT